MDDDGVLSGSQPSSQQPDAPESGNIFRLSRPFDPATMYFEVDDVIFEGESNEVHAAEAVYQQALEEKKKNNPGETERLLNHALELFKAAPTCEDVEVLKTMRSLGDLYREHDQLDKAKDILLSALKGCESKLASEHELTLAVAYSLSALYLTIGKLGEAEKLCQRSLKGFENIPAKNETTYSSMLAAMNNLALIHTEQGRRDEAEQLYLRTLELYEQYLGPEDPATLSTVINLGRLHLNQNRLEKAEKLLRRAVRGCEIIIGPNHSTTLRAVGNLGLVCEKQGKLAEAEEMFRRAVDGFQYMLGPSHPLTRKAISALASFDREQGNSDSALLSQLPAAREPSSDPDRHLLPMMDSENREKGSQGSDTGIFSLVRTALDSIASGVSKSWNDLCQECRDLDLPKAMSYVKVVNNYQYGLLVAGVGNRFKEKPDNGCPLCEMLFSRRLKPLNEAEAQVGDEIRAFSFVKWYEGVKETFLLEDPGISLCVVPRTLGFGLPAERMATHFREHGHSFCYDRLSTRFEILFPRLVKRNFDSTLVQLWLEFCRKNHESCTPKLQHVSGLKLIDCETYSLVPASPNLQYVALSYVWGKISAAQIDKETSTILASTLPPVISDVVQVTTALGFQYLWVDQYCIDQDDPTSKQEQLNQMDLIYHNAEITIVAAAGTDQSYGLPGIDSRPRTVQRAAGAGRYKIIETLADPHYKIRDSTWFTRAWTFQEGLLCRRILLFTDDQLYFECGVMNCHEAIAANVSNFHIDSTFNTSMRGGLLDTNLSHVSHHESFLKVQELLEQYTARKLSYDDDSLNAFRGVLRHYGSQEGKEVRHLWGVPYILHDAIIKHYSQHVEAYLLDGLCWRHVHSCWEEEKTLQPKRRPSFPSWSWAGWGGTIKHDREPHRHQISPFGSLICSLRLECHDPHLGTFHETLMGCSISTRSMFTYPKALVFDALMLPPEAIELIPGRAGDDGFQNYQWVVACFPASLNLSQGPASPSEFLAALHQEEYYGIFLGMDNRLGLKPIVNVFVLIVALSEEGAQRCGMMTIHAPHLNSISSFISGCPSRMVRLV